MRKQLSVNHYVILLIGHVHADLFVQGRFMIDGAAMHVKLTRSQSSFSLMHAAANIEDAPLPNYRNQAGRNNAIRVKSHTSDTCHLVIIAMMNLSPMKYPI